MAKQILICAPNSPEWRHLVRVIQKMRVRGAPTIRVVKDLVLPMTYYAIEGSHRLAASEALGLRPRFVLLTNPFYPIQNYGGLSRSGKVHPTAFLTAVRGMGDQPEFTFRESDIQEVR